MQPHSAPAALALASFTLSLAACATFPLPTEHLAQAEAGARAANELGAANEPAAALHLKMAHDELTSARQLIAEGEHKRADALLLRAQADAELSLQLTREAHAKTDARVQATTGSLGPTGGAK